MAKQTEAIRAQGPLSSTRRGQPLLQVRDLRVSVNSRMGSYDVIHGIGFDVVAGEILGIVGESGCGKSITMNAVMGLLPSNVRVTSGKVAFRGIDLVQAGEPLMEQLRGGDLAMVFQDPMTALDPLYPIGDQILEAIERHSGARGNEAREVAIEALRSVGLSEPEKRLSQYPFELSGGMRQRVIIAIALCCRPSLLICDEPTTALDVTIQATVLDLIRELHEQLGNSVVFISHNMGVIASLCDRVTVMYGGQIVERGTVDEIFYQTAHPYTKGLLACMPTLETPREEPLVPIRGTVPDPRSQVVGCPFSSRCSKRMKICMREMPPEFVLEGQHSCACWLCMSEGLSSELLRVPPISAQISKEEQR
ncbi:peptide/nickel transport system ATP-binding protein/oligopeptide transport system ATP-binding protein/dipeptide transport system ATP-binding protein [Olsenella sp. KH3B4]|uniref:ABC transporter ATP-binding protein n=1 Tax=Olsenella sp. KH3B4 TaxID=1855394 RepID=UPI0008C5BD81|nr:ABC transporter ATP-binding protein [Olsenella sp. KH3B4]SES99979.1 peptide/nickel transport system ATP-binding protein/oligopeptide transport system ATP-binding protein/dipeptide transport system ATP-binding protein [Olsenella sp. KH3B4]